MAQGARLRQGLCRPLAHHRNGHQAMFANPAEFFNSLLEAFVEDIPQIPLFPFAFS